MTSQATDRQEQASELIDVCTSIYDNMDDFIVPQQINLGANLYPEDWSLSQIWEAGMDERLDFEMVGLEREDGVPLGELTSAIRQAADEGKYVISASFERNRVLVKLDSGDQYVDRTDRVVEYSGTNFLDAAPSTDPLSLEVTHAPNRSYPDIGSEFLFDITIRTKSLIWFDDYGGILPENGRRLQSFLEGIESSLPVQKVIRDTDYDNADHMEELF